MQLLPLFLSSVGREIKLMLLKQLSAAIHTKTISSKIEINFKKGDINNFLYNIKYSKNIYKAIHESTTMIQITIIIFKLDDTVSRIIIIFLPSHAADVKSRSN